MQTRVGPKNSSLKDEGIYACMCPLKSEKGEKINSFRVFPAIKIRNQRKGNSQSANKCIHIKQMFLFALVTSNADTFTFKLNDGDELILKSESGYGQFTYVTEIFIKKVMLQVK